jgi:hypothetical protein
MPAAIEATPRRPDIECRTSVVFRKSIYTDRYYIDRYLIWTRAVKDFIMVGTEMRM